METVLPFADLPPQKDTRGWMCRAVRRASVGTGRGDRSPALDGAVQGVTRINLAGSRCPELWSTTFHMFP